MTSEERIKNIAEKWFIHDPVLFMTLMSHKITPNKGLRHIVRCGQGRIEYGFDNEEETMSDAELEDNLRAEVIRILLRHPYRHYNGSKHTAYLASNLTLNENYRFRFLKYKVADFWQNNDYKNQNFEFYYREILKLPPAAGGSDLTENQNDGIQDDENQDDENQDNGKQNDETQNDENQDNGSQDDENQDNEKQNDGKQNDDLRADENDHLRQKNANESAEQHEMSQAASLWDEDDYMEQQIKEIIEWANSAMQWGTLSGNLVQTLVASLKPEIDYRKILNGFRASILSSKQTLTRFKPSRRYGFEYMGKTPQFTTKLLIGIDVSGSISDEELCVFYSTINRFFRYGIESLEVQQFDCELKGAPIPMRKANRKFTVQGRGGTCFQPLIDFFSSKLKIYDGLIIFTDGYADKPDIKPRVARKVLWICNNKGNYQKHYDWMNQRGRCCWIKNEKQ